MSGRILGPFILSGLSLWKPDRQINRPAGAVCTLISQVRSVLSHCQYSSSIFGVAMATHFNEKEPSAYFTGILILFFAVMNCILQYMVIVFLHNCNQSFLEAGIPQKIEYKPTAGVQDLLCYKYYNAQEVSGFHNSK